jgi:hypothetical protein
MGFEKQAIFLKLVRKAKQTLVESKQLDREELYKALLSSCPENSAERRYLLVFDRSKNKFIETWSPKRNIHFRLIVDELVKKDPNIATITVGPRMPQLLVYGALKPHLKTGPPIGIPNTVKTIDMTKVSLLRNAKEAVESGDVGLASVLFEQARQTPQGAIVPVSTNQPIQTIEPQTGKEGMPDLNKFLEPVTELLGIVIKKKGETIIITPKKDQDGQPQVTTQMTTGKRKDLDKQPQKNMFEVMNYSIQSLERDQHRIDKNKEYALGCMDAVSWFLEQSYTAADGKTNHSTGKVGRKPPSIDKDCYPIFRRALAGLARGIGPVLRLGVHWDQVYAKIGSEHQFTSIPTGKDQPPIVIASKPNENMKSIMERFKRPKLRPVTGEDLLNPASARPMSERGHALLLALAKFSDYHIIAFYHAQLEDESPTQMQIDHVRMTKYWFNTLHPLLAPFIVAAAEEENRQLINDKKEVTRNITAMAQSAMPKFVPIGETISEGDAFVK